VHGAPADGLEDQEIEGAGEEVAARHAQSSEVSNCWYSST
jgi:hypothetical protein